MGWKYSGAAVSVINGTLVLLSEGKAVKLMSRHGYCVFQPLKDDEDGRTFPASSAVIYNWQGNVIERRA